MNTTTQQIAPKIIVNGAFGRMGQATVQALQLSTNFILVGTLSRNDDLSAQITQHNADIVIDFTDPTAVFNNALCIINANARPVIGTSGLLPEQINELSRRCEEKRLGGIIAPNFSIGTVLMMKKAAEIAPHFSAVEIIEMHHDRKLDSPSSTAIKTAEMIGPKLAPKPQQMAIMPTHETLAGARGAECQNIPIHSIRLPGLLAHQSIIFGEAGETLTLTHNSISRECFMPGLLFACQQVMILNELVYGLENLLK